MLVEPSPEAWAELANRGASGMGNYDYRPIVRTWVQATALAITNFESYTVPNRTVTTWVSSLSDGSPVEGATVRLISGAAGTAIADDVVTEASGVAPPQDQATSGDLITVATHGNDLAFLKYYGNSTTTTSRVMTTFDDRKLYKPNEEVTVKGLVRYLERDDQTGATTCG